MIAIALRSSCALIVPLILSGICSAHQKWLLPNFFVAEKGPVWLSFDVTWSDRPFVAESGVGAKPLWVVHPDGRRETPPDVYVGKTKSVAEFQLSQAGTYRLESIDPLAYWTQVDQEGKSKWLPKSKNEVVGQKITRSDLYWAKAVAYVTLGKPTGVPSSDDADPLELRLTQHPNQLAVGDKLELQLLSYGKPRADAKINIFGPEAVGHEPTTVITTDKSGKSIYELNTAGKFLFVHQLEEKRKDDPKTDLHSFNIYLTLEIAPRPK
jgi:hypothetical protein